MCQIQEVLVFYEHIQIGLNQSLRNLSCFSSKCKDLIRACRWRKKFWSMIGKALSHIKKNLCNAGHYHVRFVPRNSWGFDGGNSATPGKLCNFYPQWSLRKVFPALDLHKIVTEWLLTPAQYIYAAWITILTIWLNMKTKELQSPSFQLFSELGKTWKYSISPRFPI